MELSLEKRCPYGEVLLKVFEGENLGTGVFHNGGGYFIKHYENLVKTNIDKL